MKKLIFATNNANKLAEIKAGVRHISIEGLETVGIDEDLPETGNTLKENARQKVRFIYNRLGLDCFADDTGLEVDSLDGAPGVYSSRYAGNQCSSALNMEKLLGELKDTSNRNARFRTVICLIISDKEYYFEGVCSGVITTQYMGEKGFGYDPIFQPDGYAKSFAQMDMATKNKISHRGLAVNKLIAFLNK